MGLKAIGLFWGWDSQVSCDFPWESH